MGGRASRTVLKVPYKKTLYPGPGIRSGSELRRIFFVNYASGARRWGCLMVVVRRLDQMCDAVFVSNNVWLGNILGCNRVKCMIRLCCMEMARRVSYLIRAVWPALCCGQFFFLFNGCKWFEMCWIIRGQQEGL